MLIYMYLIYIKRAWIYILHFKGKNKWELQHSLAHNEFYFAFWKCCKSLELCSQSLWFPSKSTRDIFHCGLSIILHILEKRNSNKTLIRKHWHKTSREFICLYMVMQQRNWWEPYITLPQQAEGLKSRCASRHVFFVQLFQGLCLFLFLVAWKQMKIYSWSAREQGGLAAAWAPGATGWAHEVPMQGSPGGSGGGNQQSWSLGGSIAVRQIRRCLSQGQVQLWSPGSDTVLWSPGRSTVTKGRPSWDIRPLGWDLDQQAPWPGADMAAMELQVGSPVV